MKRHRMQYCEFDPDPELRQWVANYWSLRVLPSAGTGPVKHIVPPDGCVSIAISTRQAVVVGPHTAPLLPPVQGGDQWFGARLRPGAARNILGIPHSLKLHNAVVVAATEPSLSWLLQLPEQLAAIRSDREKTVILNGVLRARMPVATRPDDVVARAIHSILSAESGIAISGLAGDLGISERQLRRRFIKAVDLSPSEFRAIWRLRRCLVEMVAQPESRWSMRAAGNGYADQSHLTREFRRLLGLSPRRFAEQTATISHGDLRFPDPAAGNRRT